MMPTPKLTSEIITAAIAGFEQQKLHIDAQIADLRAMLPGNRTESAAMSEAAPSKRKVSADARRRMALGQKARWAKLKGTSEPLTPATPEPVKAKRKLSAAGRANIVAALRIAKRPRWKLPTYKQERVATEMIVGHAREIGIPLTQPTGRSETNRIADLELAGNGSAVAVWEIKTRLPNFQKNRQGGINRVVSDFIKQWKPYCRNPNVERHIALILDGPTGEWNTWLASLEAEGRDVLPGSFRRHPESSITMVGKRYGIVDYRLEGFPLFCRTCASSDGRQILYCPTCAHEHRDA